jgi:hypothetical protein
VRWNLRNVDVGVLGDGFRFIITVPSTLTINPPKDEKRADLAAKERQEEIARERQKGGFKPPALCLLAFFGALAV